MAIKTEELKVNCSHCGESTIISACENRRHFMTLFNRFTNKHKQRSVNERVATIIEGEKKKAKAVVDHALNKITGK